MCEGVCRVIMVCGVEGVECVRGCMGVRGCGLDGKVFPVTPAMRIVEEPVFSLAILLREMKI